MTTRFIKTLERVHEYKGIRFFKINDENGSGIQVCLHQGEIKKGRANCYGITRVSRVSIFGNYVGPGYTEDCDQKEFDLAFEVCVQHLRQHT